jgi:hypothetical protein
MPANLNGTLLPSEVPTVNDLTWYVPGESANALNFSMNIGVIPRDCAPAVRTATCSPQTMAAVRQIFRASPMINSHPSPLA